MSGYFLDPTRGFSLRCTSEDTLDPELEIHADGSVTDVNDGSQWMLINTDTEPAQLAFTCHHCGRERCSYGAVRLEPPHESWCALCIRSLLDVSERELDSMSDPWD
jgi:hypothetical protein